MEVFMKRIKQIFSVLAFLSLCVSFYAQGKNVTWKSMKPLDAFGESPVAVANSDSKNKAFAVSLSKELTSVAAFFFYTENEYKYSYPLANPDNERIIFALWDSKTGFFLDSICLEVSKDWKDNLKTSNHAIGFMCYDKKNGNSFVYWNLNSPVIEFVDLESKNCENGMFSYDPFGKANESYYYFWDSESKCLYSYSLKDKKFLNSRIIMNSPRFNYLPESSDEIKERVVYVKDEKTDNGKPKIYLTIQDVYIDISE